MKAICKFICGITVFSVASITHAAGATAWGTLTELYVHGSWTMVKVDGITENPDNCISTDFYAISPSDNNYNALHSSILSAYVAKKQIRFWVRDCAGQQDKYPHIISVFVKD